MKSPPGAFNDEEATEYLKQYLGMGRYVLKNMRRSTLSKKKILIPYFTRYGQAFYKKEDLDAFLKEHEHLCMEENILKNFLTTTEATKYLQKHLKIGKFVLSCWICAKKTTVIPYIKSHYYNYYKKEDLDAFLKKQLDKREKILTTAQSAKYLNVCTETLVAWRSRKRLRIPFIKSKFFIYYKKEDLDAYLDICKNSLNTVDTAKYLHCSISTLEKRRITRVRFGYYNYYKKEDLDAFLNRLKGLMPSKAAAYYLGIPGSTLSSWRFSKNVNLPFLKIGKRIYYKKEDLDAYLGKKCIKNSLSQSALDCHE